MPLTPTQTKTELEKVFAISPKVYCETVKGEIGKLDAYTVRVFTVDHIEELSHYDPLAKWFREEDDVCETRMRQHYYKLDRAITRLDPEFLWHKYATGTAYNHYMRLSSKISVNNADNAEREMREFLEKPKHWSDGPPLPGVPVNPVSQREVNRKITKAQYTFHGLAYLFGYQYHTHRAAYDAIIKVLAQQIRKKNGQPEEKEPKTPPPLVTQVFKEQ